MKLIQSFADCSDRLSGPSNLEAAKASCNADQNLVYSFVFSAAENKINTDLNKHNELHRPNRFSELVPSSRKKLSISVQCLD